MRAGLSNIVWTIIGIVLSVFIAAILWMYASGSIASYSQVIVDSSQIVPGMVQVTIRNMGLGPVNVVGVEFVNQNGQQVSGCTPYEAYLNGVAINYTLPIVIRGGSQLTIDAEGPGCANAYYVVVKTNSGYFSAIVNS